MLVSETSKTRGLEMIQCYKFQLHYIQTFNEDAPVPPNINADVDIRVEHSAKEQPTKLAKVCCGKSQTLRKEEGKSNDRSLQLIGTATLHLECLPSDKKFIFIRFSKHAHQRSRSVGRQCPCEC